MDILASDPRNHSGAGVYVSSIRLFAIRALFFVASFSSMHPHPVFISESDIWSLPRFLWISAAPNLLVSRLLLSHSFLLFPPLSSLRTPRLPRESMLSVFPCEHGGLFFSDFSLRRSCRQSGRKGSNLEPKRSQAISSLLADVHTYRTRCPR